MRDSEGERDVAAAVGAAERDKAAEEEEVREFLSFLRLVFGIPRPSILSSAAPLIVNLPLRSVGESSKRQSLSPGHEEEEVVHLSLFPPSSLLPLLPRVIGKTERSKRVCLYSRTCIWPF